MALGKKTGGRKKGTPNKTTAALKDAILTGAEEALRRAFGEGPADDHSWRPRESGPP
jgi:hypothetical protein